MQPYDPGRPCEIEVDFTTPDRLDRVPQPPRRRADRRPDDRLEGRRLVDGLVAVLLLMRALPDGVELAAVIDDCTTGGASRSTPSTMCPSGPGATTGTSRTRVARAASSPSTTSAGRRGSAIRTTSRSRVSRGVRRGHRSAGRRFAFVVAPIRAADGASLRRLGERYAIALFRSWTESRASSALRQRRRPARVVALSPNCTVRPPPPGRPSHRCFELPGRRHLELALLERDERWTGGPLPSLRERRCRRLRRSSSS